MTTTRREVLGALAFPALGPLARLDARRGLSLLDEFEAPSGSPQQVARDEDFWNAIATAFAIDRSRINFNNGGCSPSPAFVLDAQRRHLEEANHAPAYVMWRRQQKRKEAVRQALARVAGCDAEELAFVRNASEGLQTCQFGIDLEPGDEVLSTDQDYPRMRNTFAQRVAREGIVYRQFKIPVPCDDPQQIVRAYEANLSERTRLILVSHVINLTGAILPVRNIVALGRARGIPVIVDGAHSFANVDFTLRDLDCDYFATSLHKWLFAPIGTGMLHVRKDKIGDLWPLMAGNPGQEHDIRKFEEIGTHPIAQMLAVGEALAFHERLGGSRKFARLVRLRDLWIDRLGAHDRVHVHTSTVPGQACGIATVSIDGVETGALAAHLERAHQILVTTIKHEDFEGIRVSPSVYTTLGELDRFCEAMEAVVRDGLPS